MIVLSVILLDVIPCHLRNDVRVSAIVVSGPAVREEHAIKVQVGLAGPCSCSEHLTVDGTCDSQVILRALEHIAPGFLVKYGLVLKEHGVKDAVCVVVCKHEKLVF